MRLWFKEHGTEIELDHIHHYLAKQFYILIGNDRLHAPYIGKIAYATFYSGKGAFNPDIL